MTVIDLLLSAPQPDGTLQPVTGWLQWTPTRARNATEAPGTLVLPIGFIINLAGAMVPITVAPTGPDWAWRVDRHVPGYGTTTTTVAVPDSSTPVAFTDLVEVDPATLLPTAAPEAAWWAALNAAQTGAAASAVAAGNSATSANTSSANAQTAATAATGSSASAGTSAGNAAASASAAATSQTKAATSAASAAASATTAAATAMAFAIAF